MRKKVLSGTLVVTTLIALWIIFLIITFAPQSVERNTFKWYFGIPDYMKSYPIEQQCAPANYSYEGQDGVKVSAGIIKFYSRDIAETIRAGEAFYSKKQCTVNSKPHSLEVEGCKDVLWRESSVDIDRVADPKGCFSVLVIFFDDWVEEKN